MWRDHWVCCGGRWSAPTTNEVISTYNISDEGGFIWVSYKREVYGRPEPQGMLYCIYYELNQCSLSVFSPTPFQPSTDQGTSIHKKIRMLCMTLLIFSYLTSPCNFAIICSFMSIFKLIWFINNIGSGSGSGSGRGSGVVVVVVVVVEVAFRAAKAQMCRASYVFDPFCCCTCTWFYQQYSCSFCTAPCVTKINVITLQLLSGF